MEDYYQLRTTTHLLLLLQATTFPGQIPHQGLSQRRLLILGVLALHLVQRGLLALLVIIGPLYPLLLHMDPLAHFVLFDVVLGIFELVSHLEDGSLCMSSCKIICCETSSKVVIEVCVWILLVLKFLVCCVRSAPIHCVLVLDVVVFLFGNRISESVCTHFE